MRNRPLCSMCLIAFLLVAICVMVGGAKFVSELRPSVMEQVIPREKTVRLYGQIYDIENKEEFQILYLKNNSIIYQNKSFKESKIILYDKEKLNIKIGNSIEASGAVSFYERERNSGNFNQKLYYQKQNIHAAVWASEVKVVDFSVDKVRNALYDFRCACQESLYESLGEEDGAILSAMMLGEKDGMNEETKELYQANGIAHILAISGLHLSIIGVGLYQIFRRISGSFLASGIAGISFLMSYILMIGISVSVLRALIMFLFRVGADITGRHYDSPTALSVAALITVVWKPLYLFDGGFWLSYGAILAIIMVLPVFEELIFQNIWASVSITLVTFPVLLYYFYEFPLYSVIINLMVIPLMTVVLLCGMSGSACSLLLGNIGGFYGVGDIFFALCKGVLKIYERSCEVFLQLPFARIVAGQPKIWQIIVYYMSLFILVFVWRWKRRWRISSLLLVISILLMIVPFDSRECLSVTVLDVGQGDGIFIKGPEGNTYLIDGGSSDVNKVGKYRLEPFLKSQGVGAIDYVFVSHGDGDHTCGISEMIERMSVGVAIETIVFPNESVWDEKLIELAHLAIANGIRIVEMKQGQVFMEGEMTLTCLAPAEESSEGVSKMDGNEASMVLALSYGEFDMLFTGDVEGMGEESLTKLLRADYQNVNWEVLKVAHHGSKNSSAEAFLDVVSPDYALVSAGRDNSYGHPHGETVERLQNVRSEVLLTQEGGAITIVTDGEKMKVERYWEGM